MAPPKMVYNRCNCTRFRYPADDQLLICPLFQRHHSSLYSFNMQQLKKIIAVENVAQKN